MKKLNLNCNVKVRLTDEGIDIYYHQYDELIKMGVKNIKRLMPYIDKEGFTDFQLWRLMEIYGSNIYTNKAFKDISIYIDENDLEEIN